ncbi:cysteine proteinase [Dendrothele bispora CBS 962.96]|uniref:ubiquitinyl hydrolase 1 n=1 Tax=Dendrothele bispora (strain CBS 962.96) TaxID=1314807 RepID=A0A4S8M869_DENBC|nr:cysteine proteinase [Dendrothele bispora CBS 962.96]
MNNVHSQVVNTDSGTDLVGGPFAVIESDPGVFSSLIRKLGIRNVELVELYDIEPWAVDHLNPHGLVFCFHWAKDLHRAADFEDPAAERVWFANQLSDDACASLAILNVVFNCPSINIGPTLESFKRETDEMSPMMKGLAISSSSFIRNAHNSLARPVDIRGALNSIAITTLDAHTAAQKVKNSKPRGNPRKPSPAKRRDSKAKEKPSPSKSAKKKLDDTGNKDGEEAYHFIGYVPAHGKVWELDGFKSGPLEVGELTSTMNSNVQDPSPSSSLLGSSLLASSAQGWMDIVRPALRMKMQKYGGGTEEGNNNIRFSLLAIVDGTYERANDEWQYWRRERASLERRLDNMDLDWRSRVDPNLLTVVEHAFTHPFESSQTRIFASDFASRRNDRDRNILAMSSLGELCSAWEEAVRNATKAKIDLEDELNKAKRDHVDHIKRTHDYEPFLAEFVKCLESQDLIDTLLDPRPGRKKKSVNSHAKRQGEQRSREPAKKKMKGMNVEDSSKDKDNEDWEDEGDDHKGDGEWKPGRR